ncbi:MAG: hypothetical protein HND52_06045 [Ignavibacteriae bacterium]|nr:hypothetical protein [Ignavibacteriota bacterium]NOG97506.1 hypothetical protein [Ignavibacteriota bacterium]
MINNRIAKIAVLIILVFPFSLIAQDYSKGIYEFETAVIKLVKTTSNQMVETISTETIYVDKHGAKEARYVNEVTNNKIANMKTEKNSLIISDGEWMYNIDLDKKTGKKMKNLKNQFLEGMDKSNMEKFAKEMTGSMNADVEKVGEKEIAGVVCKGTETTTNFAGMKSKTTTYIYKNFVFLNQSETMGNKIEDKVIEFNEGANVDAEKFKVPNDVKLQTIDLPIGRD